jgi:manganese oxidase
VRPYDLYLHRLVHEPYPGATMTMWGFGPSEDPATASVPGPLIRLKEGDEAVIRFRSLIGGSFPHTIHWHGIHVPWRMDGTPYVSQDPIQPDQEFEYRFIAKPAGTFWYHCHYDVQHHLDMGMFGPIIIDPADADDEIPYDRDVVLFLSEMDRFHLESGQPATGNMPQSGDPFDYETWARRQAQDIATRNRAVHDAATGTPSRPERDWYPDTVEPYAAEYNTFLLNGHSFPNTEPIMIREGEVLRLRFVNAGGAWHAMHPHGHHMLVTHKDGVRLPSPFWADTLSIGPGERYDAYLLGDNPGVWDFHDHNPRKTQNDRIWPGGMMTMLVYEEFADDAPGHGHGGAHGRRRRSGDYLRVRRT